jgi:hypothetical protein
MPEPGILSHIKMQKQIKDDATAVAEPGEISGLEPQNKRRKIEGGRVVESDATAGAVLPVATGTSDLGQVLSMNLVGPVDTAGAVLPAAMKNSKFEKVLEHYKQYGVVSVKLA